MNTLSRKEFRRGKSKKLAWEIATRPVNTKCEEYNSFRELTIMFPRKWTRKMQKIWLREVAHIDITSFKFIVEFEKNHCMIRRYKKSV